MKATSAACSDTLTLNGREVQIRGEENLLALARREGIDIPTFCYHSHLSVYGACRLCLVEVDGGGIVASCSTPPRPGMKVKTSSPKVRSVRKVAIELLLANHDRDCPTCTRSATCKLQHLARRLGVSEVRLPNLLQKRPLDRSTPSLVRDPNRCILCGDCVRVCSEVQGIGAIDFAHRGHEVAVQPAFGKTLAEVDCVLCGQCVGVCPTGALAPRDHVDEVWADLAKEGKRVVAQIAPAVRVGLGEHFGLKPGENSLGKLVTALKNMGFDAVYDTSFAADLTVLEEGQELLHRIEAGTPGPMLSSCCPAWVRYAEQFYPERLKDLSSCRSPQQMFGALAKHLLPAQLQVPAEDLVVVSIMPCVAKKAEAERPEMIREGRPDVDHVLTTHEVARMIEEAGLTFEALRPSSLDMPLGFKTGAGVIFGAAGGVTEATLRYVVEALGGSKLEGVEFSCVRGQGAIGEARCAEVKVGERTLRVAAVSGLANAKALLDEVKAGTRELDFVEVMACPGGCVAGAGQPQSDDRALCARTRGIYAADTELQLHKAQENPALAKIYRETLGEIGGPESHRLLHTSYRNRRRIADEKLRLVNNDAPMSVKVCVGTNCHLRGAQPLLHQVIEGIEERGLDRWITPSATFCLERCAKGPNVAVNQRILEGPKVDEVMDAVEETLMTLSESSTHQARG